MTGASAPALRAKAPPFDYLAPLGCGEHGGDPDSVKFCHRLGLNYVSCSPYRITVARLAAAQAAIEDKRANANK